MIKAAEIPRPACGGFRRIYTVAVFVVLASLDNVATGLVPPLVSPISDDFGVSEGAIGLVTAGCYLIAAFAAVGWAYTGDRSNRRLLLIAGTIIWATGTGLTALAGSYIQFFGLQIFTAVGLGAVSSVGFSIVSDLISPRRRGLMMSLFGLSQGLGTLAGTLLGGVLGAANWHRPFVALAVTGLVAAVVYVPAYGIRRGQSEPELIDMFASGHKYEYRINRSDLRRMVARHSNIWLVLQGVPAQLAFGSLVWLPRLMQAKAEAQGYPQEMAIIVGAMFATIFQLGGIFSILGGLLGDRFQRRNPRGRTLVAAAGVLSGIPFYLIVFFVPLRLSIAPGASVSTIADVVIASILTEPTVTASVLAALFALALTSANSPNWLALIADVNLPEHRGTVYSAGYLANGFGRAAGNSLVGAAFGALARTIPPPLNYAVGLAVFQIFFVPTGIMYYLASRTAPADIQAVRSTLRGRAGSVTSDE